MILTHQRERRGAGGMIIFYIGGKMEGMQTQDMSFDRKGRRLLREEKRAMARLRDIVHKYRLLLPFISTNHERLERKVTALSTNCDESEKILLKLKSKIRTAQKNRTNLGKKIRAIEIKRGSLIVSYDALLGGMAPVHKFHLSPVSPKKSMLELKSEKDNFLEAMAGSFKSIEEEINQLDTQRAELAVEESALEKDISAKMQKEAILEKKVELYRADIRSRLRELNSQIEDRVRFTRQYSNLIATLNEAPDISGWPDNVIMEAIHHSHPKAGFIELKVHQPAAAPVSGGSR